MLVNLCAVSFLNSHNIFFTSSSKSKSKSCIVKRSDQKLERHVVPSYLRI